jgi:phosphoglycerate dehydrogenase-like enzyme
MKIMLSYEPRPEHARALAAVAVGHALEIATSETSAQSLIADADAVLGNRYFLQSLPFARRLKWMQSPSVGVDVILDQAGTLPAGLTLTCARGVYDDEMAEHALALVLGWLRGLHIARDLQRAGTWSREPTRRLAGRTALLLGWGGVARAIAARLACFGVDVLAVRRTHVGPMPSQETHARVAGPSSWRDWLPKADLVIGCLPLTQQTRNFLGAQEMAALPRGALVLNVGRGGTVDESALRDALASGHLAGAALDVFAHEPLPQEHWLWRERDVLLTPHWGRSKDGESPAWEGLFVENVRRFCAGLPLLNAVDPLAGY